MGTVVVVDAVGCSDSDPLVTDALTRAVADLHLVDNTFSTWKDGSELSRYRRSEIDAAACSPLFAEVYELSERAREMTGGWFDPWAAPGGYDPTGLVKGWAAERALACFSGVVLEGLMMNAGGDIAVRGGPAPGQRFRVGVTNPRQRLSIHAVAEVSSAVATSGTYERGGHLYNPKSRRFDARLASATVVGPRLAFADAWATALAVGSESVMTLLRAQDEYQALAIHFDGTYEWTSGFPFADDSYPEQYGKNGLLR